MPPAEPDQESREGREGHHDRRGARIPGTEPDARTGELLPLQLQVEAVTLSAFDVESTLKSVDQRQRSGMQRPKAPRIGDAGVCLRRRPLSAPAICAHPAHLWTPP